MRDGRASIDFCWEAATGWYAQGSSFAADPVCTNACKTLWQFPPDPSTSTYNQNQKLLPTTTTGVTSFTPAGTFGLFSGAYSDVNFSDDGLNTAHTQGNVNMPVPHYLHDLRVADNFDEVGAHFLVRPQQAIQCLFPLPSLSYCSGHQWMCRPRLPRCL